MKRQIGSNLRFKWFWRLVCKLKGHKYSEITQIICERCREYGEDRAYYCKKCDEWHPIGSQCPESFPKLISRTEIRIERPLKPMAVVVPKSGSQAIHRNIGRFMKHGHQLKEYRKSVKAGIQPDKEND